MLRRLADPHQVLEAVTLRRRMAAGSADLSAVWLEETAVKVMAEESGRHLEADEAERLAAALQTLHVGSLVAVANDPLIIDELVFALEVSPEDLTDLSDEFAGINVLLAPRGGVEACVLFTTDDFKLVAGPLPFLEAYSGDLTAARDEFRSFAGDHAEDLRPVLERAASYTDWIVGT